MQQHKRTVKTIIVEELLEYLNTQLARTDKFATDSFKAGIAITLENVLMSAHRYKGYTHNYWSNQGYDEWIKDGMTESWPEKNKYIVGPTKQEYNRRYY